MKKTRTKKVTMEEAYKGMILDRIVMMDSRLDRIDAVLESLKYKDAEVIDLDKVEELEGVDDSEGINPELRRQVKEYRRSMVGVDDSEEEKEHNRLLELSVKTMEEGVRIMREASEEVVFTEVELKCLRDSLVYTLQEPNSVHGNGVMNLLVKLNKMLKSKE